MTAWVDLPGARDLRVLDLARDALQVELDVSLRRLKQVLEA